MIRHISMFQMEPQPANGKTVAENTQALVDFLNELPAQEPSIVGNRVASYAGRQPELPEEAPVMFHQVVQPVQETARAALTLPRAFPNMPML